MRALEEEVAAAVGAGHGGGRRKRHRCARARPAGARHRPGRRGRHDRLHVLRDGRGDRAASARRRCSPTSTRRTFSLDPAAAEAAITERTRAIMRGAHLRAARRPAGAARGGQPPRARADRGCRPGLRRDRRGPRRRQLRRRGHVLVLPHQELPRDGRRRHGRLGQRRPGRAGAPAAVPRLAREAPVRAVGDNSRMDEIQAAVLRRFLPEVGRVERRPPGGRRPLPPSSASATWSSCRPRSPGAEHVYHLYVVRARPATSSPAA